MDQSAANVAEKTKKPENDKNYKYGPEHNFIPVKFLVRLCATPQKKDHKQNWDRYPEKPKQNVSCRACLFNLVHQLHVRSSS
jgi:hypothetical protein